MALGYATRSCFWEHVGNQKQTFLYFILVKFAGLSVIVDLFQITNRYQNNGNTLQYLSHDLIKSRKRHLELHLLQSSHDDVTKWKRFPRYWPFVWGIHQLPVNAPHKGQ